MSANRRGVILNARIKNPVGVGETYGARREETLRETVTLYVLERFG